MAGTLKLKEENKMEKLEEIAKTRMAVHTHTHTHYIVI